MQEEETEDMARYPVVQMPERPRGDVDEKIDRIYRYLWQLAETLSNMINTLEKEAKKDGED